MDEYLKGLQEHSPDSVIPTKQYMQEKPIKVISETPVQTSVEEDEFLPTDIEPPKYLAPTKIEVKRYRLKK